MKWTQSAPVAALFTYNDLAYHLKLDSDVSAGSAEQTYVLELQSAATAYAEDVMGASLITRTITATYFSDDVYTPNVYPVGVRSWLPLPRGPVQAIASVSDAHGSIVNATTVQAFGQLDTVNVTKQWSDPLTVVYTAGYGITAASVPAEIAHAVRAHVVFLYENRGEADIAIPKWLESFYRARARYTGIG